MDDGQSSGGGDDVGRVAVAIGDGTTGHAVALEGTVLSLVGERAYAPGRPLELSLQLDAGAAMVRAKTIGSKRREQDGLYDVRVRLVDLRREAREQLLAALGAQG